MFKVMALAATVVLGGTLSSCGDDPVEIVNEENDDEVSYYDYSEKGFFMNGQIKVKGAFDNDSIIDGYTKYVKRIAHYITKDGQEHEMILGYGLVVEIDDYAKFYSDAIIYNADSTAISCKGQFESLKENSKLYDANITATIDSIGKPHLITCNTVVDGKNVTLQFRQVYTKSPYSDVELPKEDEFDI